MEKIWNDIRQRKFHRQEPLQLPEKFPIERKKQKNNFFVDSAGYIIILSSLIIIKFFISFDNIMPEKLKIKETNLYPERFIGERAELILKRLTDLGPRVASSYENEVLTVDFFKREVSFISQKAFKSKKIDLNIQRATGSYVYSNRYGYLNYYSNIQNVVVKLSSTNSTTSVLMNCHYDTVPESPGASDNGFNCAILLEVLRVLATSKIPLKHNIIFLFNGGEENPLQGGHGFLSHKWSKEVKVVVNLDAAGAGGPETLFQTTGESWLIKTFSKVVQHANAGVHAEEVFLYGIIPSETDFRIFKQFGKYPGYDFAQYSNGYIYHTRYDSTKFISSGAYQHTGDNMLSLAKELANSPELESGNHSRRKLIYFDVFCQCILYYTEEFAIVLNLTTVVVSYLIIYKTIKKLQGFLKNLLIAVGVQLVGLILEVVTIIFVAKTLNCLNSTMSWYSKPWLLIPLYIFPALAATLTVFHCSLKLPDQLSLENKIIFLVNGGQAIITFFILVGTLKGIRSSYFFVGLVLFPAIGSCIITSFKKIYSAKTYLMVYTACIATPAMFSLHQTLRVLTALLPMTGRMGSHVNPEILLGFVSFLIKFLVTFQLAPILLRLKNLRSFLITLCVIHVMVMVGVVFTNYGFPYDGNPRSPCLQRLYIFQAERTFYDAKGAVRKSDSGFLIQVLDHNNINYLSQHVPELNLSRLRTLDCVNELHCGYPIFTNRYIKSSSSVYLIPGKPPIIHQPVFLEVLNQTQISNDIRRYRMSLSGPEHIVILMCPLINVELLRWSFEKYEPRQLEPWNDRKVYMLLYANNFGNESLEFDVEFKVEKSQKHIMDVLLLGHYMNDKKYRSKEFEKLIQKMPDWTQVTPWTISMKGFVI